MSHSTLKVIKGAKPAAYIVSANDLMTGDVVYLMSQGKWSASLSQAKAFRQFEIANQAADHGNQHHAHLVVGAYVLAIGADGLPLSTKERLRANGPSNYFHGKQEVA